MAASGAPDVPRARAWGALRVAGRALTTVGLVAALFLGYEFLLTGLPHDRTQLALLSTFRREIVTTTLGASAALPAEGSPVALIDIPALDLQQVAVEGTRSDDLTAGPGHLRASPLPGETGNAVIAGRRVTYGGPFRQLDRLHRDDPVRLTTGQGSFTYRVSEVRTIHAGDPDPVNRSPDNRLTLLTSDPPFLATGRLVVVAQLQGLPVAQSHRPPVSTAAGDLGLAGDPLGLAIALGWGVLLAATVVLAHRLRGMWPRSVVLLFATPIVMALLVLSFAGLGRVLPGTL